MSFAGRDSGATSLGLIPPLQGRVDAAQRRPGGVCVKRERDRRWIHEREEVPTRLASLATLPASPSKTGVNALLRGRISAERGHPSFACLSAASTRSGVIGMRVIRTPVARATAFATAAAGGTIGTSPTPRTP
jgi:hypothetical protein